MQFAVSRLPLAARTRLRNQRATLAAINYSSRVAGSCAPLKSCAAHFQRALGATGSALLSRGSREESATPIRKLANWFANSANLHYYKCNSLALLESINETNTNAAYKGAQLESSARRPTRQYANERANCIYRQIAQLAAVLERNCLRIRSYLNFSERRFVWRQFKLRTLKRFLNALLCLQFNLLCAKLKPQTQQTKDGQILIDLLIISFRRFVVLCARLLRDLQKVAPKANAFFFLGLNLDLRPKEFKFRTIIIQKFSLRWPEAEQKSFAQITAVSRLQLRWVLLRNCGKQTHAKRSLNKHKIIKTKLAFLVIGTKSLLTAQCFARALFFVLQSKFQFSCKKSRGVVKFMIAKCDECKCKCRAQFKLQTRLPSFKSRAFQALFARTFRANNSSFAPSSPNALLAERTKIVHLKSTTTKQRRKKALFAL